MGRQPREFWTDNSGEREMDRISSRSSTDRRPEWARPNNGKGDLRFSQRLAAMHILALAALVALVVASLLWVSDRHNELARGSAERMVKSAINTFAQKMEIVVRDYSIWDEAVVAVAERDTGWLYSSAGSAAADIGTFDLLYLYEPATGWSVGWEWGTPVEGTTGLVPDAILAELEAQLAVTDPTTHSVVKGFAEANGEIWGFAITRVVPIGDLDPAVPEDSYARQVHGMILSEERLSDIGSALLMEDLQLAPEVADGMDAVALPGLQGGPVAYLAWTGPTPGARILRQVALPLGLGLLAVIIVALVSSRFAVRSARRLEAALEASRAADRAKMEFLSNVSHELRTPMNGILGVLQLFEMTRLDDEQREMVRILHSSADTQMALIGELLDVIQLESGQRQLSSEPVIASELVISVFELLRPTAEQKGLQVELNCTHSASLPVLGDARAIKQIVTNLLGNAVKFTDSGSVNIDVSAEKHAGELALCIAVRDTGPGIAEADQARIFERFAQVDTSAFRRGIDGIGLGLAISESLAKRMGGSITLRSRVGAGSTFAFRVRLPLAQPRITAVAEAA